mmetsp:Transcript_20455/g.36718  ORF Transcript_20455/g.36718 Transcript_20455/m.36718 type:complete len:82 (+) Transcript_20455:1514-1759(+)
MQVGIGHCTASSFCKYPALSGLSSHFQEGSPLRLALGWRHEEDLSANGMSQGFSGPKKCVIDELGCLVDPALTERLMRGLV